MSHGHNMNYRNLPAESDSDSAHADRPQGWRQEGRAELPLLTFWVSKWLVMSNGALPLKITTAPAFVRQRKSDNRGKWTSSSSTFPFATLYFYITRFVTVFIFAVIIECVKIYACIFTCTLDMLLSCFFLGCGCALEGTWCVCQWFRLEMIHLT